jgi:hypothetical protein
MKTLLRNRALLVCLALAWLGCANGVDGPPDGAATGASGGSAGGGGSEDGGGGAGGAGFTCGNGVIDGDEECDGTDLGDASCASYGFPAGMLVCTPACEILSDGCTFEDCHNGFDDDADGAVDCADDDCTGACSDACRAPSTILVPSSQPATTEGAGDVVDLSCAAGSGPEVVFTFTAPNTTTLYVWVFAYDGWNANLAVTTACGDSQTEVACAASIDDPAGSEALQVDVVMGQVYYVTIDGAGPGQSGAFQLDIGEVSGPEQICENGLDDDHDGLLDCDDPSACQPSASCNGGSGAVGTSCFSHAGCASNQSDPICLQGGFPLGYCSEFCDLAADDCPGDAVCFDNGISQHGVCLDGCVGPADCAPGTACVNLGLASNVCWIVPEQACGNYQDDDGDGIFDCGDSDCQGSPACVPGPGLPATPCSAHNQCSSVSGSDPVCILSAYPTGYCSEFCDFANPDCAMGDVCMPYGNYGFCYKGCSTDADCPNATTCANQGYGKICS